jgi:hypothetical protein
MPPLFGAERSIPRRSHTGVVDAARRKVWTLLPAATLAVAALTGCSGSTSAHAPAASSATTSSSLPGGSDDASRTSDRVSVPFQIAAYSATMRSLTLQYRPSMCETLDEVEVEPSEQNSNGQPLRITTITVWLHSAGTDCIGGIEPPATTSVHLTSPAMGCSAELIDGATGRLATFVPGVERPAWPCPTVP